MKYIILFVCIIISLKGFSQIKDVNENRIEDKKYFQFLFLRSDEAQSSMFNMYSYYQYSPSSQMFYSGGVVFNFGINIARFFTNKFILGINYDLKDFHGKRMQVMPSKFINDLNNNFNASYSNNLDSARAYTFKDGLNNDNGSRIEGSTFENVGITFSPFPQKYGGIVLQFNRGNRVFPITGPFTDNLSNSDNQGYGYLKLKNCYSIIMLINPFKFKRTGRFNLPQPIKCYELLTLGFYYEQINLTDGSFDRTNISRFVQSDFVEKYKSNYNWGIKIGMALY